MRHVETRFFINRVFCLCINLFVFTYLIKKGRLPIYLFILVNIARTNTGEKFL